MKYEDMLAEARAAAEKIAGTVYLRQRLLMPKEELVVLLMNAYGKGVTAQSRRSVEQFAPERLSDYDAMVSSDLN
ncbi:MAG: hypothetical protein ACRDHZ_16950 [Ktedonobacteraceae bacterium]